MMRRTRSLVSRLMEGLSLQVRDTVEGETPAAPLLAETPAGYYPCPGNMVLLKADNHAAAVARMLEQRGVHYYWSWLPAKVGYDIYDEGAAVFSRAPITAAENLLLSKTNDYSNWKTRRTLGVCAGDVWYYTVHMGWWKDEEEPFAAQWETLSQAAGAKQTAFLLHVIDENVFSNIQIRDQIELLIDDPNTLVLHGDRVKFRDLLAGNIQLAAVRYIRACKYLHQRRLAGSVFAHQHMYFSGTEVKTHVFKRFHAGKYLADMTHFDHTRVRSGLLHLASHTQSFLFCFSVPAEADTDFLF